MSLANLFLANASLTIPFGVVGLVAPAFTFAQFGLVDIDVATQTLVRGYASAALGFGVVMWQLNDVPQAEHALLMASMVFNLAEAALQSHAVMSHAGFNNMVWTTLLSHGALGLWSVYEIISRWNKKTRKE